MVIVCSSCNKKISVRENYSRFCCPSCQEVEITRCKACKKSMVIYVCSKCGFKGP